ncbi:MAG: iron-containing alcohol dehydrogenase [Brevinematales bacterium]|nr:iron-containing alcohol dehydrogenase [Brevinematales bacterium]
MTNEINFRYSANPLVIFGAGKFAELPALIDDIGSNILIVRGSSIEANPMWDAFLAALAKRSIRVHELLTDGEPSPEAVDEAAEEFRRKNVHAIAAIGGGSAIDLGKAVSAMIPQKGPVEDYIEGVGKMKLDGFKVPFIAVPTTAGTGSEATKNAVISKVGRGGYKRSLRHDNLIPDIALIDPSLTVSCPPEVTAASGLDAFTQLLESFVSPKASPLTDALARSGISYFARSFEQACADGSDISARSGMAFAAYCSGAALANAGLGVVHSLAGELGALRAVPHGVLCGILAPAGHRANIDSMRKSPGKYLEVLVKYSETGGMLSGKNPSGWEEGCGMLTSVMDKWTAERGLPKLGDAGYTSKEMEDVAARSENKNNPVQLSAAERLDVLMKSF